MTDQQFIKYLMDKYGPYESDAQERFNCSTVQAVKSEMYRPSQSSDYSDAFIQSGIEHIKKNFAESINLHEFNR